MILIQNKKYPLLKNILVELNPFDIAEILGGIPLPGTGAWTGSLVAAVFDMDLKKASISILLGIFLAAVIMTFLSYGLLGSVIS